MYSDNSQEPLFKQEILIASTHHQKSINFDIRLVIEDAEPKPLVVFIHGFKGFKDWGHFNLIADNFARQGFIFVKINLSHNGTSPQDKKNITDTESFGKQTYTKDLQDVADVLDYLLSENYIFRASTNLDEIYLIGHSRGGAVAILAALEDKRIKKIATWASVCRSAFLFNKDNLDELDEKGVFFVENARTKQKLPIYKEMYDDIMQNYQKFNLEQKIKHLEIPLLLIHGKKDTSVAPESSENLKNWAKNAVLIFIEGADHTFGGKEPYTEELLPVHTEEVIDETIAFFQD
ncbi:MAG: alpha/beta fold hydrolase [Thermonemataceae bacterium]|nr:alpha/beta fold hydrolase [Thermonemataceae bacterium]